MNWFKPKKDNKSEIIKEEFKKMQDKYFEEFSTIKLENSSLKNNVAVLERKISELTSTARAHNEADIFLQCEKIKHEILNGKKKDEMTQELSRLSALQQQQSMFANQYNSNLGAAAGLFGGWR